MGTHTVSLTPASLLVGDKVTVTLTGLDPEQESWDYGILRQTDNVWVKPDPADAALIDEIRVSSLGVECLGRYLGALDTAIFTLRVRVSDSSSWTDMMEASFRLSRGVPAIDYTIDDEVAELTAAGWLPKDTKRNNLYRLMLAYGVNIVKGATGNPHFTFLRQPDSPPEIADDDIFLSGDVTYERPYSSVTVLEHAYTALTDAAPVTLFDNTKEEGGVIEKEVWFSQAPVIVTTIQATAGLTVVLATENSAILTGQGVLTGVPYTHTTRAVTRQNQAGEKEKTVTLEDDTMVGLLSSQNVLNRLFAYYCPPDFIEKVKGDIVYRGQRTGQVYKFKNVFGETETAFLTQADLKASSFVRAACEFLASYVPPGQEGLYQHCIILDKDTFAEDGGVFQVPEEILQMEEPQMKVVIIGGGTGGEGGGNGRMGSDVSGHTHVATGSDISGWWYGGRGGDGGPGGIGGGPGRVFSVVIRNPSGSFSYTIGDGGEGGEAGLSGAPGSASSFGEFSSDGSGSYVPAAGVYNPITGEFYALSGEIGIDGGKGGARLEGDAWVTSGGSVKAAGVTYRGGRSGSPLTSVDGLPECRMIAYGGNGAGAAVGVDRADHTGMDGLSDQSASWEVTEDGV